MKKLCLFLWRMIYPLLLYQMICEIIYMGACLVWPERMEQWDLQLQAVGAIVTVVPLSLMYVNYRKKRVWSMEVGLEPDAVRPEPFGCAKSFRITSMILLTELGCCLCVLFNTVLMELPISWDSFEEISELYYEPSVTMQLLCTGLIIPLVEELVFRGLGYYKMRSLLPAFPCIIISAVYFGVIHGNLVQGIYAGILGVILAAAMEWYGTLAASYVVHASANMMSVLVSNTLIGGLLCFRSVRLILIVLCTIWFLVILKDIIRRDGIQI
jgi:membrane protease YdiL (CAAX protease family)